MTLPPAHGEADGAATEELRLKCHVLFAMGAEVVTEMYGGFVISYG